MKLSFDEMRKLQQRKYRERFGFFIAEGEHLVQELEKASDSNAALRASEIYVSDAQAFSSKRFETHVISAKHMARICATQTPQGIFALVPISALTQERLSSSAQRAVYLYEVQDPGNLGTILRSLAWFGAARCLLSPGSVDPFNPKVVRASMGAIFHVPIETEVPLAAIAENYPRIAALDMQGKDIADPQFGEHDLYIFGNEARGIPHADLAHLQPSLFSIPGTGAVESLNLGTVVSLCAYAISRQA